MGGEADREVQHVSQSDLSPHGAHEHFTSKHQCGERVENERLELLE